MWLKVRRMIKIQLELITGSCTLGCYPCALHSPVVQVYATDVMENITFALLGITVCIEQFFPPKRWYVVLSKPCGGVGGSPTSCCVQTLAWRPARVLRGCLYSFQESVAIIFLPVVWPRFIPPTSTAVTSQSFAYHHVLPP